MHAIPEVIMFTSVSLTLSCIEKKGHTQVNGELLWYLGVENMHAIPEELYTEMNYLTWGWISWSCWPIWIGLYLDTFVP